MTFGGVVIRVEYMAEAGAVQSRQGPFAAYDKLVQIISILTNRQILDSIQRIHF